MQQIPGGKHNASPIYGVGAMINAEVPSFVVNEAYRYVSQSFSTNKAKTYCSATNILQPASKWLAKQIKVPFTTSDCIALVVCMVKQRAFTSATINVYFSPSEYYT